MRDKFDIQSPIIVTGRGGSGTRLLATLLCQLGVFLGNRLNQSGDGIEWKAITREMISKGIAIESKTFDDYWRLRLVETARTIIEQKNYDASHNLWGWKLPELMSLFPEFLRAFPGSRLIVLWRHPVNVCLRRTHVSSRLGNPVGDAILPAAYSFLGLNANDMGSQPEHVNNAISWEYQSRRFIDSDCISSLPSSRLHYVRYEDLVFCAADATRALCQFIYGKSGNFDSTNIELNVDTSRINRIERDDARIAKVWAICGDTATRMGYRKNNFIGL